MKRQQHQQSGSSQSRKKKNNQKQPDTAMMLNEDMEFLMQIPIIDLTDQQQQWCQPAGGGGGGGQVPPTSKPFKSKKNNNKKQPDTAAMLNEDIELLAQLPMTAYEDTQPVPDTLKQECSGSPQPQHGSSTYWPQSYEPSQPIPRILQGEDIVDEKIKMPGSGAPVLLFASTYNLTASGTKRLTVGLEPSDEWRWGVVIEVENIKQNTKVRLCMHDWEELLSAQSVICEKMTSEYNPARPPPEISLVGINISILEMYGDAALVISDSKSSIYLRHSSVENLFNLSSAIHLASNRLALWSCYVKPLYDDIVNYLHSHSMHVNDLHQCISMCVQSVPKSAPIKPISVNSLNAKFTNGIPEYFVAPPAVDLIRSEFLAHRRQLFAKNCTAATPQVSESKSECEPYFDVDSAFYNWND